MQKAVFYRMGGVECKNKNPAYLTSNRVWGKKQMKRGGEVWSGEEAKPSAKCIVPQREYVEVFLTAQMMIE